MAAVAPVVTASTADLPSTATTLVIHGFGFYTNLANDTVTFDNGVTGTITRATATTLTVKALSDLTLLTSGT